MSRIPTPLFESRLAWGIYFVPIVLAGGAVAMLAAWLILNLVAVDGPELDLMGPLMAILAVISLALAGLWVWGARRARLTVSDEELRLIPHLGRPQSVFLSRLRHVDLRRLPAGVARAFVVTDADGNSVQIGLGVWEREAEIVRLIAEAARRSGATVSPEARDTLS